MVDLTIEVDVTAEDIANGKRISREACPIALALNRSLQARLIVPESVLIWATSAFVRVGDEKFYATLPIEACAFVQIFDGGPLAKMGETAQPFKFQLELRH